MALGFQAASFAPWLSSFGGPIPNAMTCTRDLVRFSVYVDVDDTLIRVAGGKRIPVPAVVSCVRTLWERGATLYCWSAGGAEYARRSAAEVGLADCFACFLPKPSIMIDDQEPSKWPMAVVVHPMNCDKVSLEEALHGRSAEAGQGTPS